MLGTIGDFTVEMPEERFEDILEAASAADVMEELVFDCDCVTGELGGTG